MNDRAVFYCRVSTEEEAQVDALQKQIIECKQCISNMGWELVDEYVDEGKTGTTTKNRIEYNRLFNDLKEDKFDIVVIKSQDRLNRNTFEWYKFENELLMNKKRMYLYLDNKWLEEDDTFVVGIRAMLAENYSRDLSKKLNNAHRNRQKNCYNIVLTNATWGYNKVNKEIVINETEAELVRRIFTMSASGMGARVISNTLYKEGIVNRNGKRFGATTINRIIRNPIYYGTVIMNKTHKDFKTKKTLYNPKSEWIYHENVVPPIVTKELWDKANQETDDRTDVAKGRGKRNNNGVYGKIYCGCCGKKYWRRECKSKKNYGKELYYCSQSLTMGKKLGCDNSKPIKKEDLEKAFREIAPKVFSGKSSNILSKAHSLLEEVYSHNKIEQEIYAVNKQLEMCNKTLTDKDDMFIEGAISIVDYNRICERLRNKISDCNAKLVALNDSKIKNKEAKKKIEYIDNALANIYSESCQSRELINHIEKITVYKDKIDIKLDFLEDMSIFLDKSNSFVHISEQVCIQTKNNKEEYFTIFVHL